MVLSRAYQLLDLMLSVQPDIFVLQEHWLTPANLSKFDDEFSQYVCFGSSAMCSSVEAGLLRGRPYGGVMVLVSKKLQSHIELICAADRYVLFVIGDLLIVNVYIPCIGITKLIVDIRRSFVTFVEIPKS